MPEKNVTDDEKYFNGNIRKKARDNFSRELEENIKKCGGARILSSFVLPNADTVFHGMG